MLDLLYKWHKKKASTPSSGLRERIKNRIMAGSKGGKPGQWSARKAQMLAKAYKEKGGGYKGGKSEKQKISNAGVRRSG